MRTNLLPLLSQMSQQDTRPLEGGLPALGLLPKVLLPTPCSRRLSHPPLQLHRDDLLGARNTRQLQDILLT